MSPRFLFALAIASSLAAARAEGPAPAERATVHLEALRQLQDTPGMSAAVAVGGSIAWSRGVRHLLTHRSGIRHYREVEFPGTPGDENVKPYASLAEAITLFKDDPLLYRPGGPAGMSSTGFDVPERIVPHRARSYRPVEGRLVNAPYGDLTYKFASGGMISTVEDLLRLCIHLNRGTLLQRATVDLMYDAHMEPVPGYPDKPPRKGAVAFLWDVDTDEQGRLLVSRDGGVKSFRGCVVNYPREDVAAAVPYNGSAGPPTCRAARELAHFFLPVQAPR